MKSKRINIDSNQIKVLERFSKLQELEEKLGPRFLPENIKNSLDNLNSIIEKNNGVLEEISNAIVDYEQEWIIYHPEVYVARTKDIKTGKEYFTAKTFWMKKDGKKKEIKIYLGKSSDFDNDTLSPKAKEFATKKMSTTLRRRKDNGEI